MAEIALNADAIANNSDHIDALSAEIDFNAANILANAMDISENANNISSNADNIATDAAAIAYFNGPDVYNELVEMAYEVMSGVRKLTNSQALAVFEIWDADSDGSLTFEEFNQAYIDLGSPSMVLTLEEIFNSIDSDGDGISLEDHISALEAEPTTTVEPTTLGNDTTKQTTTPESTTETPEGTTGETTTGPTIDTTIEITGSTPGEPDTKVPTTTFVPTTVPTTSVDPTTTDQTTTEEPTTIETTTEFISTTDIDDETTPRINPTTTEEPTTKVPTTTDDPTTTDQTTTDEPTTTVQTTTEEPTTTVQTTTDLTSTAQTSSTAQSTTVTSGGCNLDNFEADDNGNCFLVVTTKLNWSKANKACKALGSAILATIEDNTANTFIKGKLSANSWIGATDDSTEGTWEWTNGDTFSFNKWKDSSDISNADEDCAFIASSNGKWQDYDCSKKLQYVCMEK